MYQLILASASSRRQALLQQLGLAFQRVTPCIDESPNVGEDYKHYAKRMAKEKAQEGYRLQCQRGVTAPKYRPLILAADTCGELDGQLLNKPVDFADAKRLLTALSGKTHVIYSAFALYDGQDLHAEVVSSYVSMCDISDAQITAYWQSGEPQDKAGAYAIQGKGAQFVAHLAGSYSAVMGLPLFELSQALGRYRRHLR